MKLRNLALALLLLCGEAALAAIASGYYRIKSNAYEGRYITENVASKTLETVPGMGSYAQVWYINAADGTIRNALTDRYIQANSAFSAQFTTGAATNAFTISADSPYTFAEGGTGEGAYGLHCAASQSYQVVRWYTNVEASAWTVEAVSYDASEKASQQAALTAAATSDLTYFFTSAACTALKSAFTEMSDDNLRSAMSALPTSVQDLAVKVKNNAWMTYAGWDKTEKTFRVASYRPYSSHTRWAGQLGMGHTLGRLSNPTGIYAAAGDVLQVYVGAIPAGESVKLEIAGYGQGAGPAYDLHEGMNTVLAISAGNCFVFYEVDNTTRGAAPYTALSNYADVTVHIEGGTVQGCFDLTRGFTDSDWSYLKANMMSQEMFCLKTKTLVFNLQTDALKHAVDEAEGGSRGKVVGMLEYWQGIQDMEDELFHRSAIGGDDYAYCNNVHTVTTTGTSGDGSLYAFTYGIYFSPEQHDRLFNYDLFRLGSDNLWAAAHELGHHRQTPINMVGNTEVSNNIYSNVAVYQQGRYTSRTADIRMTFWGFANGASWPERVCKANAGDDTASDYNAELLHLNWQLYQYFHILGHAPDFFPSLFDALRADPMTKVSGTGTLTPALTDYLKYYVKCCQVSGYDLTEFFAAYGFFLLPPEQAESITYKGVTTNRYQSFNDYGDYNLYVTQEMIDAAKAEVAGMSGLKPCNLVFIEDRVTAPLATYDGHADGELRELNAYAPVTAFGQVGTTGQYTDFGADCSPYRYNVSKVGKVVMAGTGAVGFLLRNAAGEAVAFYNTTSFFLPEGTYTAAGLAEGYSLCVAAGNGDSLAPTRDETIIVTDVVDSDEAFVITADAPVAAGAQVTAESSIVSGQPYLVYYVGNGYSGYMKDTGSAYTGKEDANPTYNAVYIFTDNGDGTWSVQNFFTHNYWGMPTADANSYIGSETPGAWKLNFQTGGNIAPSCNGHSWNRSGSNVHPHNEGTANVNQLRLYAIGTSSTALSELRHHELVVASEPAATIETGQWYTMYNRGNSRGYLYENVSTHTLYNTATLPAGEAGAAACYLVRLVGSDGSYALQDGFGNYFGKIQQSTAVPVTALAEEYLTVKKIATTDGHYYLTSSEGVVLDANDYVSYGESYATVVGWGTTVPTATGGNNDWAFYPVEMVEEKAFYDDCVAVTQAFQTTGRGNERTALLRITLQPVLDATDVTLHFAPLNETLAAASSFSIYELPTATAEFYAAEAPTLLATTTDLSGDDIQLHIGNLTEGTTHYLWLTASVKDDAPLGAVIDAALTDITYTSAGKAQRLDLGAAGNPEAQGAKVFDVQAYTFLPTTYDSRCYRIPAMIVAADGSIIVAADKRYADHNDIGNGRVIDIVLRRSTDGGKTWSEVKTIARGEGKANLDRCAYGDPTLVRCADGTLISTACVGNIGFTGGLCRFVVMKSTDNGQTWTDPDEPTTANGRLTINPNIGGFFITSGKGLLTPDGTIMYLVLTKENNNYVIYSTDNGQTWTIDDTPVCTDANEAKLELMNDGSLIASIRTNGNRAFNRGSYVNNGDGTLSFTWGKANADLTFATELRTQAGNNQDILYYSRSTKGEADILLHTMTSGNHANLKLFFSLDQGQSWKEAFVLQPGGSRYAAIQRLTNGDLAILFEDGALGQNTPANAATDGYQYPINFITLTRQQLIEAFDALEDAEYGEQVVKVVYDMSGEGFFGTLSDDTWTSNATQNPLKGVTLTKSDGEINRYSNWNSHYNMAYHPVTTDTEATLTLTAPEGYLIKGYSMLTAKASSDNHTYTLTTADGTTYTPAFSNSATGYTEVNVQNINIRSTYFKVSTTDASKWLAIANFAITVVKESGEPRQLTYVLVDVNGQEVTSVGGIEAHIADRPTLPATLERRPFCTYGSTFYKDVALTEPLTSIHSYTSTVYSTYDYAGPVEFSTEEAPKWYLLHFREQNDANLFFANANGTAYCTTAKAAPEMAYGDEAYHWAFIGSPYGAKIVNRATRKPIAAPATSGANGSDLTIGVNDDAHNFFSIYGYGGVLDAKNGVTKNAFTLILNDSKYAFLTYDGKLKYYSDGVYLNNLSLAGWRSSDVMATPVPEAYPLTLSPINGKSYATLYLPFGVTLPGDVTAYKIAVNGEWARPTEMGQEVPAETAALLVSESAVTECRATVNGDASADASGNALQGVLKDTSGADLNGYVLNIVDGQLGFYRLSNSGTLAAYHAYLPAATAGNVKGFVLNWDELAVGIGSIDSDNEKVIYNLAGQRISKLQKGVNIVGGKKVLVK